VIEINVKIVDLLRNTLLCWNLTLMRFQHS